MQFTDLERKLIILAMDPGSADGERAVAASKFVAVLMKRYRSGHEFIADMDAVPERVIERVRWIDPREQYGGVIMRFGKYRMKPLREIPVDYLLWVLSNVTGLSDATRQAIEGYLGKK